VAGAARALAAFAEVLVTANGCESFARVVPAYRADNRPDPFERFRHFFPLSEKLLLQFKSFCL
jgi:hypothetical protein